MGERGKCLGEDGRKKAPEHGAFQLSQQQRDFYGLVPVHPVCGPENPIYRATLSFFISLPFSRRSGESWRRHGADY
jgi:hypothetical protein